MNRYRLFLLLPAVTGLLHIPHALSTLVVTDVSSEFAIVQGYPGTRVTAAWDTIPNVHPDEIINCPYANCYYGVGVRHNGGGPIAVTMDKNIHITYPTTWGQAAALFKSRYGDSGTYSESWTTRPSFWQFCASVASWRGTSYHVMETNSSCTPVPITPVSCSITGAVEIDHGVLDSQQLDGHVASGVGRLNCSRPATLSISVIPPVIDLAPGLQSTLQINGLSNGDTITTTGSTDLSFVSRLSGSSTIPGVITGSSIVIMNVL
ncbi:hypothetical protein SMQC19_46520 (plasmid) [Serratia marcescens]|nr:hypothetical protein SMQC19_46520 [Serratia marcescens]